MKNRFNFYLLTLVFTMVFAAGSFSFLWAQASAGSSALKYGFKAYKAGRYHRAMEWYLAANAIAEYNIGVLHAYGQGVPQSYKEAMRWYRKAAQEDNGPAENNIGVFYERGLGVTKNLHTALKWYRRAAENHNEFGIKNYKRLKRKLELPFGGKTRNHRKTIPMLRNNSESNKYGTNFERASAKKILQMEKISKVAEKISKKKTQPQRRTSVANSSQSSSVSASANLIPSSSRGRVVRKSAKTKSTVQVGSIQNQSLNDNNAGNDNAIEMGDSLVQNSVNPILPSQNDNSSVVTISTQALIQSNSTSNQNVGGSNSDLVASLPSNPAQSSLNYTQSNSGSQTKGVQSETEEKPSEYGVLDESIPNPKSGSGKIKSTNVHPGKSFFNNSLEEGGMEAKGPNGEDYVQIANSYQNAANHGDVEAEKNMAIFYLNGFGVPKDYKKAFQWYLKAAAKGDADAETSVGLFYDMGVGVAQDYKVAMAWYLRAAEQGDTLAQNCIGYCYELGHGVGQDADEALDWYREAASNGDETGIQNIKNLEKAMLY